MTLRFLSTLSVVGASAALALALFSIDPVPIHAQGKGGGNGGGGGQNEAQNPSKITFDDSQAGVRSDLLFTNTVTDAVTGDPLLMGGSYEGFDNPNGLEVFIGSAANGGNIFLRTNTVGPPPVPNAVRDLNMTLPAGAAGAGSGCAELPDAASDYDFHFANAKVDQQVSSGLFGIPVGETRNAPLRIRFFHNGQPYFLDFDADIKGNCKAQSDFVSVTRLNDTQWQVFSAGRNACIPATQRERQGRPLRRWAGELLLHHRGHLSPVSDLVGTVFGNLLPSNQEGLTRPSSSPKKEPAPARP